MKAVSVHGGGASFVRTSCNVGRRGQYGPEGIDRLNGLEGTNSPDDMNPSSSASQSERTDEQRGEVSLGFICRCNEGGFRCFDLLIALRRYFMGTFLLPFNGWGSSTAKTRGIPTSKDIVYVKRS